MGGLSLLAVYGATLAPDVTLWDAGEFVAAASSFGIPHPPGTPLYVALARTVLVAAPGENPAAALAALSAVATAAACALGGRLVARWLGDWCAGVAASVAAGAASSVWLNATEPEVYSLSLLLAALALTAADRARDAAHSARWHAVVGYAFGLAAPLHLSALTAVPGVAALAAGPLRRGWRTALLVTAAGVLAAGIATMSAPLAAAGVAGAAVAAAGAPRAARTVPAVMLAVLLGASGLLALPLRARHDPAVNQGNPATLAGVVDVVGRRQYLRAGVWPRQAPLWLQLGNVLEYADWQFALGLAPGPTPSPGRSAVTLGFAALGYLGARAHRQRSADSWRALATVGLAATVGIALYLNFKAGPSLGWGILPDDAPHEARERDYFFALGFWVWGLWAGAGAVLAARRARWPAAPALGLVLASAPIALNWRAVDRRGEPQASLARRYALALLGAVPDRGVLLAAGDNDSYPLWYVQQSLGRRGDVTVVTVPLLPAAWYRAELARRHGLLGPSDTADAWRGEAATLAAIAAGARRERRALAASGGLGRTVLAPLAPGWRYDGLLYVAEGNGMSVDRAAAERHARALDRIALVPSGAHAGAARHVRDLLACPGLVVRGGRDSAGADLLATLCGPR